MITGATPLFERLPVDFADPVSLAAQQAEGRLTLIVVSYPNGPPAEHDGGDGISLPQHVHTAKRPPGYVHTPIHPHVHSAKRPPCYDVFVCKAPVVVTVAHVTPEFRFPIPASRALKRYYEAREAELGATLSLYELGRPLAGLFLETVYYQECLKLYLRPVHRDWDADVVSSQIKQTGCHSGVLEMNDFTDPHRPRITLYELGTEQEGDLRAQQVCERAGDLHGRVLLYDRARNRAVAHDRGCATFDTEAVMKQATRFAETLRAVSQDALGPITRTEKALAAGRTGSRDADEVEQYLCRQREAPLAPPSEDAGLISSMAAMLSGHPASLLDDLFEGNMPLLSPETISAGGDGHADPAPDLVDLQPHVHVETPVVEGPLPNQTASREASPEDVSTPTPRAPSSPSEQPISDTALLAALRAIIAVAREELTQHFGQEKADLLWREAAERAGLALPVPAQESVPFLRALVTLQPPRRIMRFRQKMRRVQDAVAADLHAVHSQFRHLEAHHGLLLDVARLWSRCTYE